MWHIPSLPFTRFTRSMSFRLVLMFLCIELFTVIIVAYFASHSVSGLFRTYLSKKQAVNINAAIEQLNNYALKSSFAPDPQVEQGMVEQIGQTYNIRVIVVTPAGKVIASNEPDMIGRTLGRDRPKIINPQDKEDASLPSLYCTDLSVDTVVVATNTTIFCPTSLLIVGNKSTISTEQNFLDNVNFGILLCLVIAALAAFILALTFSYTIIRPMKHMIGVAQRMEAGDLGQRLTVKTYNEIAELAHALNTMADGLQRSEQLRRNMINDIAHELRTPLTNIRGYLEALQDEVILPAPETIASLYEESTLLTRLVSDLQELSLAEAGKLCLLREPVSLKNSIEAAGQMLHLRAAQKAITLHICLPNDLPMVEADPERIAQILRNLLGNAITYTPDGGQIRVTAHQEQSEVVISVTDSGSGIEAEHLPYLFERFYRADPSRTRATGGTGLGLAIVKQLVLAHGGEISVQSWPGQGSCFSFSLPARFEDHGPDCATSSAVDLIHSA